MPTFQELERALINADKAGDKEAATVLARELRYQINLSKGAEKEKPKVEEQKPVQPTEPSEDSSDLLRGFTSYLPQLQETYGGAKVFAGKAL
jgi:hypothetical protein